MSKIMKKKETTDVFETMEKRLYNYIMRPAMFFMDIWNNTNLCNAV